MERRKNVEKWASVFWEGRVAAVAAADYEKHQQTQQWPSLTLLHTRTVKVTITKGTRRRRIKRESAAFLVAINRLLMPMLPNSFFFSPSTSFLLQSTMRPFFYFFYSFSFVRSSKRWEKKKRRHKLNFVGCKEYYLYDEQIPKKT
jgi:hypothetical protein